MPPPRRESNSTSGRPSLVQRNSLITGNLLATPVYRSSAMSGSNSGARKSFLPRLNTAGTGEGTSRLRKSTEFSRGRLSAAARASFATGGRGAATTSRQPMKTPERSNPSNSLAPSSAQSLRLSSVSSRASISVFKKKDTRPISDPAFKKSCVDSIFHFLVENDYQSVDVSFNRKSITHPTTKDFVSMFNFIYGKLCLVDDYQLPARFDEEIPKLLKRISYPTILPKSTFASIGSQHTMPAILAMLSWLTGLVQDALHWGIKDLAFPGDFESPYLSHWNDINAVIDIMQHDSDDHLEEVFQKYKIQYEEEAGVSENQIITSREELNALLDDDQRLSYELQNIPPLGERNEILANDIASLKTFQKKLHAKLLSVNTDKENLEAEVQGKRNVLNQLNEECERVKEMREIQQYTPEEVRSIKNHVLSYSDTMQQMKDQLKDINEKVWERERAVVGAKNELSQAVIAYNNNEAASTLGYIDTMASNGFDRLEMPQVNALSEAAEEMVRSKRRMLMELVEKKRSMERERDDVTQQNNMKAQQIIRLESRINYVKDDLECCHQENSTEEAALQKRCEELDQAIASVKRGQDGAALEYNHQELERIKKQHSEVKQYIETKTALGSSCLNKMVRALEEKVEWERRQAEEMIEGVRGAVVKAREKHSSQNKENQGSR